MASYVGVTEGRIWHLVPVDHKAMTVPSSVLLSAKVTGWEESKYVYKLHFPTLTVRIYALACLAEALRPMKHFCFDDLPQQPLPLVLEHQVCKSPISGNLNAL